LNEIKKRGRKTTEVAIQPNSLTEVKKYSTEVEQYMIVLLVFKGF